MQKVMSLYTFIAEFDEGTFVSQFHADNLATAPLTWAEGWDLEEIEGLSLHDRSDLIESIQDEKPAQLDNITNSWCFTAGARGKMIIVHFVETKE